MRKWLIRLGGIGVVVFALSTRGSLADTLTDFFIGGILPFANLSLGTTLSYALVLICSLFIYKAVASLRLSMLKRNAVLYSATHANRLKKPRQKEQLAAKSIHKVVDADELELLRG